MSKSSSSKKTALVVLSETFKNDNEWYGFITSTTRKITGDDEVAVVVKFHNKKVAPRHDLKSKIESCPDVVVFHKCDPATIKKTVQHKCAHLKTVNFYSIGSIGSKSKTPEVKEIEKFHQIFGVVDITTVPPKTAPAESYVGC